MPCAFEDDGVTEATPVDFTPATYCIPTNFYVKLGDPATATMKALIPALKGAKAKTASCGSAPSALTCTNTKTCAVAASAMALAAGSAVATALYAIL